MKQIYSHENRFMVENAKNMLELTGIECHLTNENMGLMIGELPPGESWLRLWVTKDSDFEEAERVLKPLNNPDESNSWRCYQCGEPNLVSFSSCWNCQTCAGN